MGLAAKHSSFSVTGPWPSLPLLPLPHTKTRASAVMAALWLYPQLMLTTGRPNSPRTSVGRVASARTSLTARLPSLWEKGRRSRKEGKNGRRDV
jgi:hypothetical protein